MALHDTVFIHPKQLFKQLFYTKLGQLPEGIDFATGSRDKSEKSTVANKNSAFLILVAAICILAVVAPLVFLKLKTLSVPEITLPDVASVSEYDSNIKTSFINVLPAKEHSTVELRLEFIKTIIDKYAKDHDSKKLALAIVLESRRLNIDPILVTAIILEESGFKFDARSHRGAMGIMQIMPKTAEYIEKIATVNWPVRKDLYNPVYNIRLGVLYLKYLGRLYGQDLNKILLAYNWGPENLGKNKSIPKDVVNYSRKIRARYQSWLKIEKQAINLLKN